MSVLLCFLSEHLKEVPCSRVIMSSAGSAVTPSLSRQHLAGRVPALPRTAQRRPNKHPESREYSGRVHSACAADATASVHNHGLLRASSPQGEQRHTRQHSGLEIRITAFHVSQHIRELGIVQGDPAVFRRGFRWTQQERNTEQNMNWSATGTRQRVAQRDSQVAVAASPALLRDAGAGRLVVVGPLQAPTPGPPTVSEVGVTE